MSATETWRVRAGRVWPHLRAILVIGHICAVIVYALPSPARIGERAYWKRDTTQEELRQWAGSLDRVGIDTSAQGLEEFLWNLSQGYVSLRRHLIRPFTPYSKYSSVAQGWRMFTNPQRRPARLHLSLVFEDGREEDLFIPHSDQANWRRRQFDHNRFRKQLGRLARDTPNRDFDFIASWAAKRAAGDFPLATKLRVRLYRWRSLDASDVRAGVEPDGNYVRERLLALEPLR